MTDILQNAKPASKPKSTKAPTKATKLATKPAAKTAIKARPVIKKTKASTTIRPVKKTSSKTLTKKIVCIFIVH